MLGMATHEPHFSLLREEIKFGKSNKKQMSSVDTTTFHLLHLSVLREYLYYEFLSVKVSRHYLLCPSCMMHGSSIMLLNVFKTQM